MLIDERTYVIAPGKLARYLAWHMQSALPIMREHLGEPWAYFQGVDGELNTFVHQWAYQDLADRQRKRAGLYTDPRWLSYRNATGDLGWVLTQTNRLLQPITPPLRNTPDHG